MPPDLQAEILTKKYKELVEIETKKHGKHKKVQPQPDNVTADHGHAHAARPRRGSRSNETHDVEALHAQRPRRGSKVQEHENDSTHSHDRSSRRGSKKPEVHEMLQIKATEPEEDPMDEEKMSYEMQMVMDEVSDLHLGDFDKNYTTNLVHKVFNNDKYDRLHKPKSRDEQDDLSGHGHGHSGHHNPHVHHNAHASQHTHADEQHQHETTHECFVCSMFFDSEQALDFHTDYSDLHRTNLHLREKRLEAAHMEAIRLTGLARKVMHSLYKSLPAVTEKPSKLQAQPGDSYDAVVAVINAQEAHHVEVQSRWKRALDRVLHRNLAKRFARILETRINVPKGVEMMYEGSKYFHRTKSTYDLRFLQHEHHRIFEIIPHFIPFDHATGTLAATDTASFIPAKRIYLNYDELLKAFFGYNIVHPGLTAGPTNLGTAPHMEQVKGAFHSAEIRALAIFVSNRLKIHKSHTVDDALFFDLHKVNHDMLIKELPRRFAPLLIEADVVRNIWVQRIEEAQRADAEKSENSPTSTPQGEKSDFIDRPGVDIEDVMSVDTTSVA